MRPRIALYAGNFFYATHFFLVLPILTTYLATFLPENSAVLVISAGALLTIIAFPFMPFLVRRIGVRRLGIGLACVALLSLFWLALSPGALPAVALVALVCGLQPLFVYLLDLLLEASVLGEAETGRIRTLFMTWGNVALVSTPLIIGMVLGETDAYWRVFALASVSLLPFLALLTLVQFPEAESPSLKNMWEVCVCLCKDSDFRAVGMAYITLQFFYHLAPFFVPLYLHNTLGIPWSDLGWMFAIMVLPFVLLEYPAGWLADRKFGDQELMALGFLITGTLFACLAFVTVLTPPVVLVVTLFLTRVGAALVEAMAESHFFRRVSQTDVNTVGVFRMMRPIAALLAPLLGSLLLVLSSYSIFFFVMGMVIIIFGVSSALSIKDVR